MAKTPDQVKNIVEEWMQLIGKSYENVTATNPDASFGFKIGNIMIYSLKNRSDRVIIESMIGFAAEHREASAKLKDLEWEKFFVELIEPLTLARLGTVLGQEPGKPKQINHIGINSYIDTDSLNRESFFKNWDIVAGFRQLTIKKIQIKFGVKGIGNESSSSDNKMYS